MTTNDNNKTVVPYLDKDQRFTDFRVFCRAALEDNVVTPKGILVVFDDETGQLKPYYCNVHQSQIALAAAQFLADAAEPSC